MSPYLMILIVMKDICFYYKNNSCHKENEISIFNVQYNVLLLICIFSYVDRVNSRSSGRMHRGFFI